MGMIVIETRTVVNKQVTLEILERYLALAVTLSVLHLIFVIAQFINFKAAHIKARILKGIVPTRDEIFVQITPYKFHGFHDDVHGLYAVDLDAVFRLYTAQPAHGLYHLARTRFLRLFYLRMHRRNFHHVFRLVV